MIKLGTDYNFYRQEIRDLENQPEITFHTIGQTSGLQYSTDPNITRSYQSFSKFILTNLVEIQNRFNKARDNATRYDYGVFLLQEEVWHPAIQVSWGTYKLSQFDIVGSINLPNGDSLDLLKTWFIKNKGAWNQTWWDNTVISNNLNATVLEWSAYFGYTLMKAWHEFMHSLGKKSAFFGICGFNDLDFSTKMKRDYFPGQMFDYLIQNYELITTGIHPKTLSDIPRDISWLSTMKNWGYKGKIMHILPVCWSDGHGLCPWDSNVAKEDFKQAIVYADIVLSLPFADASDWTVATADIPNHIQYIPIVINWIKEYNTICPPLECNLIF